MLHSMHSMNRQARPPARGQALVLGSVASFSLATLLIAGCTGNPGLGTSAGSCTESGDCGKGEACVGSVCIALCNSDRDCNAGKSCVDGLCTAVNTQCSADTDCDTPGPCEVAVGAYCSGGTCHYGATPCTTPPANECVNGDTTFRAYASPGTCNPATDTCEYGLVDTPCTNCTTTCLIAGRVYLAPASSFVGGARFDMSSTGYRMQAVLSPPEGVPVGSRTSVSSTNYRLEPGL